MELFDLTNMPEEAQKELFEAARAFHFVCLKHNVPEGTTILGMGFMVNLNKEYNRGKEAAKEAIRSKLGL